MLRTLALIAAIVAITAGHYLTDPRWIVLHNLYQRLYYVPIILACVWFGLRGGVLAAVTCAVVYAPHIVVAWSHSQAYQVAQFVELAVFGLIALLVGLFADRERRLREEVLAQAEAMRRADRMVSLGTLAGALAHEIRNPLAAIQGALEILEPEIPASGPGREFYGIVRREVERLGATAGRYLDFVRPQPPEMRDVDLAEELRSAADLVRRSAEKAGVDLAARAEEAVPVRADPVQIRQVLVNLLLNAVQSMPRGGTVEVATGRSAGRAWVRVRDHGPGLPPNGEKIFEPFHTSKPGGVGLGLAISRQIAVSHGGTLEAAEAPGGGAAFTLTLPAS